MGDYELRHHRLRPRTGPPLQRGMHLLRRGAGRPAGLPEAMAAQSIADQQVTEDDLKQAFSDLLISDEMLDQLGPAINSGRGMFLFGEPGNGKTSIAERVTRCFGSTHLDPAGPRHRRRHHPRLRSRRARGSRRRRRPNGLFDLSGVDRRWVQHRPAHRRRRRRTDDGGARSHAEPADEDLRGAAAAQEQLRHARHRRLRPPDDAGRRCCSTAGSCRSKSGTTS